MGLRHVGVTQSHAYQMRWQSRSIHTYPPCCPSMALLSLCIKPLSLTTLTPRQTRLSASTTRNLLIFHDFIPAVSSRLQPLLRPVLADRGVSLARSRVFPPGCIAKSIPVWKKREAEGREEWATVAEARVVFEKGEPRHISLQTNNFWIFISCFSLPACEPVSKANATLTTECSMLSEIHRER